MAFGNDLDAWQGGPASSGPAGPLALIEKNNARSFLGVSWAEVKLLVLAGVGFFLDAYDLFIINMIYAIILVTYKDFHGLKNITWGLEGGVLKASANMGNIIGQVGFGFLGDYFGRSAVYGKELIIIIIATILIIAAPDRINGYGVTIWMACFRVLLGIGIGGDYPMSASVVSDRSHLRKRGAMLATIFSAQGFGNLFGAVAAVVVIACYKGPLDHGHTHKLSGAWRILQGLSLIPAFAVLYFRLTLVESTRFTQARALQDDPELLVKASKAGIVATEPHNSDEDFGKEKEIHSSASSTAPVLENEAIGLKFGTIGKKPHNEFIEYFSEWRHLKLLLGTAINWFLVDITFYGINLNQSSILQALGFTSTKPYSKLMLTATGNLIITCAGFLPGYFFTIGLVEIIGRKPIQLLGFTMNTLFLGLLGGLFNKIKGNKSHIFPVFVFLQFFFNFGANATTFIVPAEVFPTRVKATAHGISAASGKCGAILASLLFGYLSDPKRIGSENVFWIFTGVSVLGMIATVFLTIETKGYDADEVDRRELAEKAAASGHI